MWLENYTDSLVALNRQEVSILLLLDVAGKLVSLHVVPPEHWLFQSFFFWMWLENNRTYYVRRAYLLSFNPSSSGCGWKT